MQGNLQRFLPILLLVFLLLFVLPAILHHKKSTNLSAKELSQETIAAMNIVVAGQKSFTAENGRYTGHVADLIQGSRKLAKYLADGVLVSVDASTNGKTYYTQVASGVHRPHPLADRRQGAREELRRDQVELRRRVPGHRDEDHHLDDNDDDHHRDHSELARCSGCRRSAGFF